MFSVPNTTPDVPSVRHTAFWWCDLEQQLNMRVVPNQVLGLTFNPIVRRGGGGGADGNARTVVRAENDPLLRTSLSSASSWVTSSASMIVRASPCCRTAAVAASAASCASADNVLSALANEGLAPPPSPRRGCRARYWGS